MAVGSNHVSDIVVLVITSLLLLTDSAFSAFTWYALATACFETQPSMWPVGFGLLVSTLNPAVSVYAIVGNSLAAAYVAQTTAV